MAEKTNHASGAPAWVDLSSSDVGASAQFYAALFAWDHADAPGGPESTGGYGFFLKDGKQVAGIGPLLDESQPPSWTTYVSVDDADAAVSRVREAGGTVTVEPMDVMDVARLAYFVDPTGALLGVMQPGIHRGAQLVDEPGALTWSELNTRDPVAAKAFYSAVFGWDAKAEQVEEGETYTRWLLGEDPIGGLFDMRGRIPDRIAAHWLPYFTVEDIGATIETATSAAAELMVGPRDVPRGRFAILRDRQGARFAIFEEIVIGP